MNIEGALAIWSNQNVDRDTKVGDDTWDNGLVLSLHVEGFPFLRVVPFIWAKVAFDNG